MDPVTLIATIKALGTVLGDLIKSAQIRDDITPEQIQEIKDAAVISDQAWDNAVAAARARLGDGG